MVINYTRLFNLRLGHDFFTNGNPGGLHLKPTVFTTGLLRSGRMLMKPLHDGITVLYESADDEITPKVRLQEPFELTFALYTGLLTQFLNITHLRLEDGRDHERGKLLWFNIDAGFTGQTESFTHDFIDSLRPSRFTFRHNQDDSDSVRVFSLQNQQGVTIPAGRDADGALLPLEISLSPDENGTITQQINLLEHKPGVYTIRLADESGDTDLHSENFYMDPQLNSRPPLGIIQLRFNSYPHPDESEPVPTQEYRLQFAARSAHWRYYVMNRSGKVIHNGGGLEALNILPGENSEFPDDVGFDRLGNDNGEELRIDNLDTVVFRSSEPIPFREQPFTGLQLVNDDIPVLKHLPNPSPSATLKYFGSTGESETFIYI